MTKRARGMGWLSVYVFTERKGKAERHRWRVCGADGVALCRSEQSFSTAAQAEHAARRVLGLLASVFALKDRRAA